MKSPGLALLALVLALPAHAQSLPGARTVTLKNGLRLVLSPDSTATAVDLAVWYPAGSGVEPAGQSGITHVVEHLMFRGSAHVAPLEFRECLTIEIVMMKKKVALARDERAAIAPSR